MRHLQAIAATRGAQILRGLCVLLLLVVVACGGGSGSELAAGAAAPNGGQASGSGGGSASGGSADAGASGGAAAPGGGAGSSTGAADTSGSGGSTGTGTGNGSGSGPGAGGAGAGSGSTGGSGSGGSVGTSGSGTSAGAGSSGSSSSGTAGGGGGGTGSDSTGVAAGTGSGGTGGGDSGVGTGSGGTGVSAGVGVGGVDGFGSIIVNGVRFDTASATYDLQEITTLAIGHVVRIDGSFDASNAKSTAAVVHASPELQGTVAAVNAGASTFTVLGQQVSISSATVFDGMASVAGLAPGDAVRVSGLPFHAGQLLASRISRLASAPSTQFVTGQITAADTAARRITVGAQSVSYTTATTIDGGQGTTLRVGAYVRVQGSLAGGVLAAARIRPWQVPAAEATPVSWSGVVSDYASLSSFNIAGQPVDASSAQITGGPASSIGNGVRVELDGTMLAGVLKATKLRIKHVPGTGGPVAFTVSGTIGAYSSAASFRVQGQPIDASGAGVVFANGARANLGNGRKVTVTGSSVVDGVLIANTVTFD